MGFNFTRSRGRKDSQYMKHTFIFSCTDKQEAIRKGMNIAKKFACGDICGDWECKLKKEVGL